MDLENYLGFQYAHVNDNWENDCHLPMSFKWHAILYNEFCVSGDVMASMLD